MTIVYVTSHPHSGSTLLSLLLGSHARAVTLGEAKALSETHHPTRRALRRGTADVQVQRDTPCM